MNRSDMAYLPKEVRLFPIIIRRISIFLKILVFIYFQDRKKNYILHKKLG